LSSNLYFQAGSTKKWKSTGGDALFTFTSVASAAGRIGARLDLGDLLAANSVARAGWYRWYVLTKLTSTTPVIGNTLDLYFGRWNDDATPGSGDGSAFIGSSDAAFSTAAGLNNMKLAGSVVVDAVTTPVLSTSGLVFLPYRYVSPILWNGSGAAASSTATDHEIWLTPVYPQAQ
jgi:hypothetical protein